MRRNILNAQPARSLAQALRAPHPARRTLASLSTKNTSSQEQAHPVGPFYEAILNSAQPIPAQKPEKPPVTAKTSPPSPPIAPAPKPTPTSAKEPASSKAEKATKPAGQAAQPAEPSKAADDAAEPEAPAKRARKTTTTTTPPPTKPKSVDPPSSSAAAPVPAPTTAPRDDEAPSNADPPQARVIFGSSLAGPAERAERLAAIRSRSRLVAGVRVPPRPDEPDNCCMSGCVNCVWDRYRDEMEEWAAAHSEAERRLRAQEVGAAAGVTSESMGEAARSGRMDVGVYEMEDGAVSMDEDGGGSSSDASWDELTGKKGGWDEELYKNVPVGIREFMKQEKRLKEKHLREGTLGG
ncbi:oxidoreductase-like protein [Schizothecium vesticola]|uniref:Oxidoreductase-like protein n=1 Tax=Schizothecium vesticola TaxID=314040 RepID=A0AA40EPB4_9PEZI|nr:oxidoreductase-like protein [Schizothecium vesticola]